MLRSVGLEPVKLSHRVKLHFIARLAALVEPNATTTSRLGPRGTGKSYFFSEFSPCHADFQAARRQRPPSSTTTPAARSDWWVIGMW